MSAKVTVVVVVATEVPPAVELPELVLALAAAALSVLISFKRLVTGLEGQKVGLRRWIGAAHVSCLRACDCYFE